MCVAGGGGARSSSVPRSTEFGNKNMKASTSTVTAAFGTAVLVALCVALRTSEAATAMQILPRNPGREGDSYVVLL